MKSQINTGGVSASIFTLGCMGDDGNTIGAEQFQHSTCRKFNLRTNWTNVVRSTLSGSTYRIVVPFSFGTGTFALTVIDSCFTNIFFVGRTDADDVDDDDVGGDDDDFAIVVDVDDDDVNC